MTLPVLYSDNLMRELDDFAFEYSMPADAESQPFAFTQSSEVLETQMVFGLCIYTRFHSPSSPLSWTNWFTSPSPSVLSVA